MTQTANTPQTIIQAKDLVKSFQSDTVTQTIINHLDLDIYAGDFTVIMGSSGAGKSTLMYMLSGMDQATAGEINFMGQNICQMTHDQLAIFRRRNCGFVFQQIYMLDKMSLMDNVLVAGLLVNPDKKALLTKAKDLFAQVNLPAVTYRKTKNQVSGGECQRAGIVRAAINDPAVIFADEPTGALNSENSQAVLDVFTAINQRGQSIVMVTHDQKSALRGNRVIYLKDGKICGELRLDQYTQDSPTRQAKLTQFLQTMGW